MTERWLRITGDPSAARVEQRSGVTKRARLLGTRGKVGGHESPHTYFQ
jgi:hypothetical protein